MAGIFRLHNKFHRSSHHTLSGTFTQEQGIDPIASLREPFNGIFYNNLTDQARSYNILTNSYEWYSTYVSVSTLSANWDSIGTTYSTVNANSANWSKGYSAYISLNPVSANYNSVYTTVRENSANWGDPNVIYTNRVQEVTHSKTFSAYDLTINRVLSVVNWNLDIAQVAFLTLTQNVRLLNPNQGTQKKGGIYTLYVIQGNGGNHNINFDSYYKFPVGVDMINDLNKPLSGVTVINFISDGSLMFGDYFKVQI
jgi:hypothetical protein